MALLFLALLQTKTHEQHTHFFRTSTPEANLVCGNVTKLEHSKLARTYLPEVFFIKTMLRSVFSQTLGRASANAPLQKWGRALSFQPRPRSVTFSGENSDRTDLGWAVAACGIVQGNREALWNVAWSELSKRSQNNGNAASQEHITLQVEDQVLMMDQTTMDKSTFVEIAQSAQSAIATNPEKSTIFMVDGVIGSGVGAHIRAVTDDAATAGLMTLMLRKAHAPQENESSSEDISITSRPDVVLVHSVVPDEEAPGAYCASYGKKVAVRGNVGFQPIAVALAQAVSTILTERKRDPTLCLLGNLYLSGKESSSCDAFMGVENVDESSATVASHHLTWNREGVAPLWNCISQSSEPELVHLRESSGEYVCPGPEFTRQRLDRIIFTAEDSNLTPTETCVKSGRFALSGTNQERVLLQALVHSSGVAVHRGLP